MGKWNRFGRLLDVGWVASIAGAGVAIAALFELVNPEFASKNQFSSIMLVGLILLLVSTLALARRAQQLQREEIGRLSESLRQIQKNLLESNFSKLETKSHEDSEREIDSLRKALQDLEEVIAMKRKAIEASRAVHDD